MSLPLLIGEQPSKTGDRYHNFPLSGRPARVICTLAGIPPQPEGTTYGVWTWALYDYFECHNLIQRYTTAWDKWLARMRADYLIDKHLGQPIIVCLGRKVGEAFGVDVDFYEWTEAGWNFQPTVMIPHPSGLNRLLNDPEHRQLCGKILREAIVA